jgi:hypothetical protein
MNLGFRSVPINKGELVTRAFLVARRLVLLLVLGATLFAGLAVCQESGGARKQGLQELLDTYPKELDPILDAVLKQTHLKKKDVQLKLSTDESLFSIYSDGAGSKVVHVNLGGLSIFEVSSLALALSWNEIKDGSWWMKYVLYNRKLREMPNSMGVEPEVAAGLEICDVSDETAHMQVSVMHDMLTFVVAHEVGHVALKHNGQRLRDETDADYLKRRRNQELAADDFALTVTRKLKLDANAPIAVLLTHLIISGQKSDVGANAPYPGDDERIKHIVDSYLRHGGANEMLLSLGDNLLETFSIGRNGVTGYDVLDHDAWQIKLSDLRVPQSKLSLHPSAQCLQLMNDFSRKSNAGYPPRM